jgi:hypothetical protein
VGRFQNASANIGQETQPAVDNRRHLRFHIPLAGQLFVPAEKSTIDCVVVDLSADGAGVRCEEAPPLHTFVVLYIDGFGRYGAVVTRYVDNVLSLQFSFRDAKREHLVETIRNYVNKGSTSVTQLRAHERVRYMNAPHYTRPCGESVPCEIIDISPRGMSLKTRGRPPINELIHVGNAYGRVVRHHESGFSVEFILSGDVDALAESDRYYGGR